MKKFISFVMAAAMVASLVPATAFAAGDVEATVKVLDALNLTKQEATDYKYIDDDNAGNVGDTTHYEDKVPELRFDITRANYRATKPQDAEMEITVTLDNAEFLTSSKTVLRDLIHVYNDAGTEVDPDTTPFTPTPGAAGSFASAGNATGDADAANALAKGDGTDFDDPYRSVEDYKVISGLKAIEWGMDANKGQQVTAAVGTPDAAITLGSTGDAVEITKGGVDVEVVTTGNAWAVTYPAGATPTGSWDSAKLVAALQDGWTFKTAGATVDGQLTYQPDGATAKGLGTEMSSIQITKEQQLVAEFEKAVADGATDIYAGTYTRGTKYTATGLDIEVKEVENDRVTFLLRRFFEVDETISIDLASVLTKTSEGKQATVSVESDMVNADDLVYVSIGAREISASTRKQAVVAEEEVTNLEKDLVIKSKVGDFAYGQWFELKLSKGFEFTKKTIESDGVNYEFGYIDGNTAYFEFNPAADDDKDEITIKANDIEIEAASAKSGAVCTLTVKALDKTVDSQGDKGSAVAQAFNATTTVEIAKVVDYKVVLSVDEDEDVPVIYSGVNVDNYGITDDSDHMSLEVTAEETFPGAWSMRKGFNFELPEHVYVTDVKVTDTDNFVMTDSGNTKYEADTTEWRDAFWNAYQEGSHVNFEFVKRVFDDVNTQLEKDPATVTFQLELVADPGFEGDVVLKLTGELVDEQEVTIAKFVKPYEVKAEQNDIIIDYRYTDIPTAITITEAEAGLWEKGNATFFFSLEKAGNGTFMEFEDDPTFEIDSNSDLEIKNEKAANGRIQFTVKTESDEPATVTMKDMQLFMNRSIPAGPYDLEIDSTLEQAYVREILFAPDANTANVEVNGRADGHDAPDSKPFTTVVAVGSAIADNHKEDSYIDDVADYSSTVKEAFVNVITAGRDVDDASFTTKVVVPVGESYMVAGEKQIELDVPAYINAAGYTMLPIRAVATALGISNSNVLWDQPTKTVTILYGQRIITMTQGQKVVYVNGSAIPASAAVENTNSRTFLPMRDLATALGVTDITWDQATRTATLNGNQK